MKVTQRILCSVICHGASEVALVKAIASYYRITINIFSRQNGKMPIELTSLEKYINKNEFQSRIKYLNKLTRDRLIITKDYKLINHKIFIIMDVDGYEREANLFLSKEMFKNHWAYDYIVPILSNPDLDYVMFKNDRNFDKNNKKPKQYQDLLTRHNNDLPSFIKQLDNKRTNLCDLVDFIEKSM